MDRRSLCIGSAAALLAAQSAGAQVASVEIVAADAAGDGDDQLARAVAEGLNQTHLIPRAAPFNVPGDGGRVALEQFAAGVRPKPGLMVMGLSTLGTLVMTGAAGLERCLPLARLTGERQPIVVAASSPMRTLQDLIATIRADPAAVRWGGRAPGGTDHQLALLITQAAGVDPKRLNYRPGDHRTEVLGLLISGEVAVATGDLYDLIQQVRGGTLRAVALSSAERANGVDIPTCREQGVDVELLHWRGLLTRRSLDPSLRERFDDAIEILVQMQGWAGLMRLRHWADIYAPAEPFAIEIAAETERLAKLFRAAATP